MGNGGSHADMYREDFRSGWKEKTAASFSHAQFMYSICCAEEMGQKLRISRHGEERRKGEKETEKENKGTKRKGYGE
jgi:hypothetical protein